MMEGAGFEVIDLGIDVPAEKFIQAIEEISAPAGRNCLLF